MRDGDYMHSSYADAIFSGPEVLNRVAARIMHLLRLKELKPDSIAVTGTSGVIMGAVVSALTGIPLIVVRKGTEKSHSSYRVEGFAKPFGTYIILDDLIATGDTMKYIQNSINERAPIDEAPIPMICLGVILYHGKDSEPDWTPYGGRADWCEPDWVWMPRPCTMVVAKDDPRLRELVVSA